MAKIEILALLLFAYMAGKNGHPLIYALIFTAVSLVLTTIGGDVVLEEAIINGVIILVFSSGYFWLAERFSDNKMLFIIVLLGGVVLWIGMPLLLEYADTHVAEALPSTSNE